MVQKYFAVIDFKSTFAPRTPIAGSLPNNLYCQAVIMMEKLNKI
jgi:hypothetical protein